MTIDFRAFAPQAVRDYWSSVPNSVRALYATLRQTRFPWGEKEVRIEAWGQLCFDDAAARATAYHMMWNNGMRKGWAFVSWRCEMDAPPTGGGKLAGSAPADFSLAKYGPPCAAAPTPEGPTP